MSAALAPILGSVGDAALRALLSSPALVAFDFDGTLAPIVELPPLARLQPEVDASLRALAERTNVAIVSGRGIADLRERADIASIRLIGNHGNDTLLGDSAVAQQARRTMASWREQLQQAIDRHFGADGGVEIEDKQATLSIHFRRAADPLQAERELHAMIAALEPTPKTIGGKFVVNVLPPGARTKLEALRDLADELGISQVAFVGDDVTDEIVFAAAPPSWLTVRVEPQGPSGARFALDSQHQIARLIERIIELLPAAPAGRSRSS
ncbi:MAG: trehalose-phosphatase [Burkholderiaceae bacterium]|jgi:trehalose 6-phosphate phosphatase|nr:trehalose-phosphatase [Burkholderiaceae bacterium]